MIAAAHPRHAIHPTLEEFREKARCGNLIPVWRECLADFETPVSAFRKLARSPFAFLLESVEQGEKLGRYSFIGADPSLIFKSKNGENEILFQSEVQEFHGAASPLETLRRLMGHYQPVSDPRLPAFYGGAVGFLAYDVVRDFERLPNVKPDDLHLPDAIFMIADNVIAFDHVRHRMLIIANAHVTADADAAYAQAVQRIETLHERLRQPLPVKEPAGGGRAGFFRAGSEEGAAAPPPGPAAAAEEPELLRRGVPITDPGGAGGNLRIVSNFTQADFEAAVRRAKEYIFAGDIFQVVLSQRLSTRITCDPFDVYRAIRAINPSPYMCYLKCGDLRLAGSSPEILAQVKGRRLCVRPIAGTRPRGLDDAADRALEADLLADEKERAEHVMLVDLGRNDVGRVCNYGSVRVDEFMTIERYSHVMHIVSNVTGELREDCDAFGALAATFPAGTVSGAPKIRAMEIIEELEPCRRGPYAGAFGYVGFGGDMDTGIAIRTAVIHRDLVHVQAGAGIVADSDPGREYQETLNKARALMKAIEMAEEGVD